jgi:HEAT repeat protein/lysophospholipase L1-like esterase
MKARLVNLLLAACVSLLTLGLFEGGARLWERAHPPKPVAEYLWDWQQKWDGDFYVFDSDAVGWPPWEEFNADGVRDRTHAVEKPEGVRRVVFLGDSVTLGDGIKPEQAYPQQVEARLRDEGRPVEVFNVGLLGWSTRQERIAYPRLVRRYRPDQVVLAVCLNDIPELQNNLTRPRGWLSALHRRSALVRAVVRAPAREIGSVEELFERRESKKVRDAMARFFDEVRGLRDAVRADGATFAMIVFPFRFQVVPGAPAPTVQDEIRAFAESEGVAFRDLRPAVAELGERAFVDYDHLSPAGARRVAQEIVATGLLDLPPPAPEVLAARGRAPLDALRDADPAVRGAAVWEIGRRTEGGPAVEAALAEVLREDASEPVRAAAARALGARGAASAAPALFAALGDPRAAVRWAAAQALSALRLDAAASVPGLVSALGSSDVYVRGFAAWSLGNLEGAAAPAVPALIAALDNEEAFSRAGAALALSKIGAGAQAAVPALIRALEGPEVDRRWKAARALGRIGPAAEAALPSLLKAAREDHEYVRAQAVRAVARIAPGRADVVATLQAAAKDRDPEVRRQADLAIRGRRE